MKDAENVQLAEALAPIRDMVKACIQCGTCSASCPNAFAMADTPRRLWRMLQAGEVQMVLKSDSFSLCSACYTCTLRCPRGLPLTDAMSALKQVVARQDALRFASTTLFYRKFMESVRRHGRVRETEFMCLYLTAMKNPLLPFQFAPLGLKLFSRKKLDFRPPSKGGDARMDALFQKVHELENAP